MVNFQLITRLRDKWYYWQVSRLREDAEGATEAAEEERLRRRASEMDLTREMEAVERSCDVELRRASSAHSLDVQHLEQVEIRIRTFYLDIFMGYIWTLKKPISRTDERWKKDKNIYISGEILRKATF